MKLRVLLLAFVMTAFFSAGCGASLLAPPTPTSTPVPTQVPTDVPTATAAPTIPAATPTDANALPPAIAFALNKTQQARSLKFDFESAVTLIQDGKTTTIPGLALKGSESTLNRQVTISGTTSDTNELITYDVVVVGEDVYIKGLSGGAGLDETEWYQLPAEAQAGVRRLPSARGLVASFTPEDVGKAQFTASGSETIDNETCSVWTAQNPEFARTLIGVTEDSDLRRQLGEIDKTEFKMWTCADGFIHLMVGSVEGRSAQNAENKSSVNLRFAMTDFEQALDIQPPASSKPFPTPPPAQPTSAVSPTTAATGEATAPAPTERATGPAASPTAPSASPTP